MTVMLMTEFLSLKGGCRGSSESTHVKMPHCWNLIHWLIYFIDSVSMFFLFLDVDLPVNVPVKQLISLLS